MMTMTMRPKAETISAVDDVRWQAVVKRDPRADGTFVYAVKTTGVYCRPSCAARLARRENVTFHPTPADAERDGFRACLRCKPNQAAASSEHAIAVAKACKLIARAGETPDLEALAAAVEMSSSHFHRIFKSLTGLTPKAYANAHRAKRVRDALMHNDTVTSAIYNAGFNSNSRFYATSEKVLGMKPTEFQSGGGGAAIQFAVGECSLGSILVAASARGICSITLGDDAGTLVQTLQDRFSSAQLIGGNKAFEKLVAKVIAFVERPVTGFDLPLDVQGTAFQQRVWQKLCEIPCGESDGFGGSSS